MKNLNKFNFEQMVSEKEGKPITTSLKVAEYFSKRHDNVLRSINSLDCSNEFRQLNFEEADYIDEQGKLRPMYTMTKNGFMFLVMGFTGEKAAAIKETYIKAFDWMHDKLTSFMNSANDIVREFEKEKALASDAGRKLRSWQCKKPLFEAKMKQLESYGQGKLFLN